jgi:PQQ-dependent dehydrogenase (s-GDH family)
MIWGPDNFLWVTEKLGKRIDRINPADGAKTTVLTIDQIAASGSQDGLLGLAFADDAAYVAYTYNAEPGPRVDLATKIVRYHYDQAAATLSAPTDILTRVPASIDHEAGRLILGPDHKLYFSIGDLGNNQFDRACLPIRAQDLPTAAQVGAQDWSTYQGKVLRINLDGSIPADNPVIHGVRSHIFTYGHRNAEGLTVGPGGRIFSDEHGPKTDDEINLLQPGKNYGWPYVAGFRDGQAYQYYDWSAAPNCAQLPYDDYDVPASVPKGPTELEWKDSEYAEPLKTLYTVPNGYNFKDPTCAEELDLCWPTIAPSSIAYLPADNAPNPILANSLLVTALKTGSLFVFKLSHGGTFVQGDIQQLFRSQNRYRDLALSPDHTKIYIATDGDGVAGPTGTLANPGSILEFALTVPAAGTS